MKANPATAKAIGLMMFVLFLLNSAVFLSAKEQEMYKTGLEQVNQWRAKKGQGQINKGETDGLLVNLFKLSRLKVRYVI